MDFLIYLFFLMLLMRNLLILIFKKNSRCINLLIYQVVSVIHPIILILI